MTDKTIEVINSQIFVDHRGILTFFPSWDLSLVKRTYIIEHPDTDVVRGWQGHQKENKWFVVIQGEFKILLVQPNDWANPSPDIEPTIFTISSDELKVLNIPGGFASCIKAVKPNSKLMVFSNFTTEESKEDDFRFDKNFWCKW